MKYIIQAKFLNKVNYLQQEQVNKFVASLPIKYNYLWLFEEYKQNATKFETIQEATKKIASMLVDWLYTTWTILEDETYHPVKEISISDYN